MRAHEFSDQGAAGIILYAKDTGRYGLQQRADNINDGGQWAAWGGGREPGESLEQCAKRELAEESGYTGPIQLQRLAENPKYVTFIGVVPNEFEPRPDPEWKDYCWVEAGDWPTPMHPGVAAALKNIPVNENFADGKHPGRKGLAKRVGVNCKQSVSKLRSIAAHSSGEKQRMAHWCANMKSGRDKTNESENDQVNENTATQYPLWAAMVTVTFPNYTGRIEATVTAPSANIARQMFKAQYNVQDWHVGSIKRVK